MSKESLDEIYELIQDDIVHLPNHSRPISGKLRLAITIRLKNWNELIQVKPPFL